MDDESFGSCHLSCSDLTKRCFSHAGLQIEWFCNFWDRAWTLLWLNVMNRGIHRIQLRLVIAQDFFGLIDGDISATNKCFGIQLTGTAFGFNEFVHHWLGVTWLIALVMTAAAVTDHIDHDIFIELLAIFKG